MSGVSIEPTPQLLAGERAAYGAQIVARVSRQLAQEYGRGFNLSGDEA
jgi:hypothetical protein